MEKPKLTHFSHGSGCGCKIAPADLERILNNLGEQGIFPSLLVGLNTKDDAAVFELPSGECVISTTDFFMPIVDDAKDFGKIASANAISDVYAMGGTPLMAVAILGWPIEQLGSETAGEVLKGACEVCTEAGIPLAGGHSIDSKEPFFGLAVTGTVAKSNLKQNIGARAGDLIYLSKPLGIGMASTAMKRGILSQHHIELMTQQMSTLNKFGIALGKQKEVHSITDVTGFGLLGHLIEMCEGAGLQANIVYEHIPKLPPDLLQPLFDQFVMPNNTMRNFKAYGHKCSKLSGQQLQLLCDPQTNGGLLFAVDCAYAHEIEKLAKTEGTIIHRIGMFKSKADSIIVNVN